VGQYRCDEVENSLTSRADVALAWIGWLAVALFVVFTVVPGLVPGKVFLGTDLLATWAPWNSGEPTTVVNRGVSDTIDSVVPQAIRIREGIEAGDFPEWDPYNNGGTELGALPNSGMFSPVSLPWWFMAASQAPAAVKILESIVVVLGFQLLLRKQWRLPRCVVPLAVLTYISSGFMVAWTNWPQTRVAAYIPLLFWVVDELADRGRWRSSVILGLVVSAMFLGGFPAVIVYSMYVAVPYFIVRSWSARQSWKYVASGVVKALIGTLIGVGLSAFQMAPFAWLALNNVDFAARTESTSAPLPATTLATAAVPLELGPPDWSWGSWPVHFVEGFSYVGAATLLLAAVAIAIGGRTGPGHAVVLFFTAVLVVLVVSVYFESPVFDLVHGLPGIQSSAIGRMRSVIAFVVAVLGALGITALVNQSSRDSRDGPVGLGWRALHVAARALLGLIVPCLIGWQVVAAYRAAPGPVPMKWIGATVGALILVGLCAIVAVTRSSKVSLIALILSLLVTTLTPAIVVARAWWPISDESTFYPETAVHAFLRANLGSDRYATVDWAMAPGTSTAYGLRSVTGHSFTPPEWRQLLQEVDMDFFRTATWSTIPADSVESTIDSGVLDRLGVTYIVCRVEDCHELVDHPSGETTVRIIDGTAVVQRTTALERIRWASGAEVIVDPLARLEAMNDPSTAEDVVILERMVDSHDVPGDTRANIAYSDVGTDEMRAEVETTGPGWLVIEDPLRGGGWHATLDGEEVGLVNAEHAGVAVFVPGAGHHSIRLTYEAPWFRAGILVTVATVLTTSIACSVVLIARRGKRKSSS
jgi:hypothetical protein